MASQLDGTYLRPRSVGDILDASIRLYRRHYLAFTTLMAACAVAGAATQIAAHLLPSYSASGSMPSAGELAAMFLLSPLVSLAGWLVVLWAMAAAARMTADALTGRPVDAGAAAREALGRLRSQFWGSLLVLLAIMGLSITVLGIPVAIYFGLGWALVTPAIMVEGLGGRAAMRRSSQLVRGHRMRVVGLGALVWIIAAVLSYVPLALVGSATGGNPLQAFTPAGQTGSTFVGALLVEVLSTTLVGALGEIAFTLLYFDLRVREEAFDLEVRAEDEGPRPLAAAA